jgi:predicted membrane-bound mannosyltransferase
MKINRITIELGLFLLAAALALSVRLLHLGYPLSDFEAEWALRALAVSRGEHTVLGPGPGYALLTGATFFLLDNNNAIARLWPALVGSALVFLPFMLRKQLGQLAALVFAFGIALNPGLVASSRLVGGPMLSIGFGLLAITCWVLRKPALAGLFGGLALLSGPATLHGLLPLAIIAGIGTYLYRRGSMDRFWESETQLSRSKTLWPAVFAAGGAILVAGTLFLRYPEGLGALAGTVPEYLSGWLNSSGIPASRLIAALIVYQPLVLVFAIIAGIRAWREKSPLPRWLSLWALGSLILVLIYPGRQVSDLAWVLVPMWGLAGLEIARYFSSEEKLTLPPWERRC